MSTLVAERAPGHAPQPPERPDSSGGSSSTGAEALLTVLLAAALAAVAFVAGGGSDLASNTWVEVALVAIGAAGLGALLVLGARGRRWGATTFAMFTAYAALTAASVLWSVQPDGSWTEANRTFSYLAVFGGGIVLARLLPERWAGVVSGVALATTVISAYALLAKAFPATFDPGETFGRLRVPFDYWNATGLIAALGLPPCLWAGARRERARAARALAPPAISILVTVIVLSYSRGSLAVGAAGLIVWFAVVPLRLRAAAVLALGLGGAAAISAYGLHTHALTADLVPLHQRVVAGRAFGLVILAVLAVVVACGFAVAFALDRTVLSDSNRRRIGLVLIGLVALIPIGGVAALANSSRGFSGEVSHLFHKLTNASGGAANSPGRLVQLGNSRGRYWHEGLIVGEHNLLKGAGALGYQRAVVHYVQDYRAVPHAHSFAVETFADFGLIGVAVMVALLVAWGVAAWRPVRGPSPAGARAASAGEHAAVLTLLCVVIIFGLHSSIDWTWFVPGTAIPALLCAGWLAGRGPLDEPVGRVAQARRLTRSTGVAAALVGLVVLVFCAAWGIYQPLRSSNADTAALAELLSGHTGAALSDARTAASSEPVAAEPLWQLAAIYGAIGDRRDEHGALVQATQRQPLNAQAWIQLGQYNLSTHHSRLALADFTRAASLDRTSFIAGFGVQKARAALAR